MAKKRRVLKKVAKKKAAPARKGKKPIERRRYPDDPKPPKSAS